MKAPLIDIKELLTLSAYVETPEKASFYVSRGFAPPNYQLNTQVFRAGFYMVGLCISGNLKVRVNFRDYNMKKSSLMAFTPTTVFQLLSISKNIRGHVLIFDKDFLLQHSNNSRLLDTLGIFEKDDVILFNVTDEQAASLIPIYKLIKDEYDGDKTYKEDIARSLILSLLYQCTELYIQQPNKEKAVSTRKDEIKAAFLQLVKKHCKRERKLSFYAKKLYISPKHLMETIKDETGKTAGEIIDEAVILEAKLLLGDKDKNIQQIAEELHFPSQTFFTKFFKRHTEETPSAWRNKN